MNDQPADSETPTSPPPPVPTYVPLFPGEGRIAAALNRVGYAVHYGLVALYSFVWAWTPAVGKLISNNPRAAGLALLTGTSGVASVTGLPPELQALRYIAVSQLSPEYAAALKPPAVVAAETPVEAAAQILATRAKDAYIQSPAFKADQADLEQAIGRQVHQTAREVAGVKEQVVAVQEQVTTVQEQVGVVQAQVDAVSEDVAPPPPEPPPVISPEDAAQRKPYTSFETSPASAAP